MVSLELSEAGEQFYSHANQILSLNDLALSQFSKNSISGKVRLGIPSEFATILLPKIVSRFAKAYPNVTLEVNCELSKMLLSKAGKASHDLILALQNNPRESSNELVKMDELVWVTSTDHNAHKAPIVPLIAAAHGCIYRHRAIAALDDISQPWQIVYTIPDLTGIQYAIQEGLGVTVLARSTVPENLRILPTSARFPDLGSVGISLITAGKTKKNEAVHLLTDFLKTSLA